MPVKLADKRRSYANYAGFVDAESGVPAKPANTIAPALTGTAQVGSVLTVDSGTWTGNPLPKYRYTWFAGGERIDGADATTYTLTVADAGKKVSVQVIAISPVGQVIKASNETALVAMKPVNDVLPAITGTAQQGQVLTATSGDWTAFPTPPTYVYAWQRDGTPIAGATVATYTLVAGDVGKVVSVKVTATSGALSTVAESLGTEAVAGP